MKTAEARNKIISAIEQNTGAHPVPIIDNILESYAKDVAEKVAIEQKRRDWAVYSINRTKTPLEIKDAMFQAPLVTSQNK